MMFGNKYYQIVMEIMMVKFLMKSLLECSKINNFESMIFYQIIVLPQNI